MKYTPIHIHYRGHRHDQSLPPPPRKLTTSRASLLLLVSALFIFAPARAADTFAALDGLPEPRVATPDLNLPEQIMSREVQAAMKIERGQPRHDKTGKIHYIIDLTDTVTKGYSDRTPIDERLGDWHKPAMYGVAHHFEARYKFKATSMFSWVGNGFTAYLTPAQAEALQHDPQVARITEDYESEFSAVWANQPSYGSETIPWNIAAVGGNKPSAGLINSVRAYVLDGGVGYHSDLTNVAERYSDNTGVPPVGCYPHATHVAGIISSPRNGLGVTGVDSSVPVVSVSVMDAADTTYNCGKGSPLYVSAGLDKIKALIAARGRVGVVNISMNKTNNNLSPNLYSSTETIGQKIKILATPAPGYPGAFIVQSAGNYAGDACGYAYNAPQNNDGIMVVGALDSNGQPVTTLNGMNGFRNTLALSQAGSNYGSCVDIWVPGNNIYSTWAMGANQYGYPSSIYGDYATLSGTSMAAPHVAGVAAWLAEIGNLTTPAQIEAAVRSYARSDGAKDPGTGQSLLLANADGASYTAQPTAEFTIGGMINGNLNINSTTPFILKYDSVGAQYCNLTGYLNNAIWYQVYNFSTKYDWGAANGYSITLPPGNYRWVVDCYSAAATMSSAQATATVTSPPPTPTANFYFNNAQQTNPTLNSIFNPWPSDASSIKEIPYYTQPFYFSYNSVNTSTCALRASYAISRGEFWSPWYTVPTMPTYYSWPPVTLDRNYYYWWELSCAGSGGTVITNFFAHVY